MLKDGVLNPERLVDITRLPLRGITLRGDALRRRGADHDGGARGRSTVLGERRRSCARRCSPAPRPQLRNMATIGGNLLQRTRCRYFRDPAVPACNKRAPGSRLRGHHRVRPNARDPRRERALHRAPRLGSLRTAGRARRCRARPGDGRRAEHPVDRVLPCCRATRPDLENVLAHGELITADRDPAASRRRRSGYLKVRDRASYEFALTSAAVALVIEDGVMTEARVALGGVGTIPWRARGRRGSAARAPPRHRRVPRRRPRPRSSTRSPCRAPRSRSSSPSARSCARCETVADGSRPRLIGAGVDRVDGPLKVTRCRDLPHRCHLPESRARRARAQHHRVRPGDPTIDDADARAAPGVLTVITHETAPKLTRGPVRPAGPRSAAAPAGRPHPPLRPVRRRRRRGDAARGRRGGAPGQGRLRARRQPLMEFDDPRSELEADPVGHRRAARRRRAPASLRPTVDPRGDVHDRRRTPTTRSGCSRRLPRGRGTPSPCTTRRSGRAYAQATIADGVRDRPDRGPGPCALRRRRVRRRPVRLAARDPRRRWPPATVGRPVKLVLTRPQMFTGVGHRPSSVQTIRIGAHRDGELVAIEHDSTNSAAIVHASIEPITRRHGALVRVRQRRHHATGSGA